MMTTDYVCGSPRWIELGSQTPDASADSCERVFGWEAEPAGSRFGDYLVMSSKGAVVGGIGPRVVDDEPPSWTVYFHVDDVDGGVRRARGPGGTLQVEPTEVFETGTVAHVTDPQGGWLGLWWPGAFPSMEVTDRPDTLCRVERCTSSVSGAKEFDQGLFGRRHGDVAPRWGRDRYGPTPGRIGRGPVLRWPHGPGAAAIASHRAHGRPVPGLAGGGV